MAAAAASLNSRSASVNSPVQNQACVSASSAVTHSSRADPPDWIVMPAA